MSWAGSPSAATFPPITAQRVRDPETGGIPHKEESLITKEEKGGESFSNTGGPTTSSCQGDWAGTL